MPTKFNPDDPWCSLPSVTPLGEGRYKALIRSPGARCYGSVIANTFADALRIALAESVDRETLILAAATALTREQLVERARNIKRRALIDKHRAKQIKNKKGTASDDAAKIDTSQ